MAEFARRVRNRLAAKDDLQQGYIDAHGALMAVADKCEAMRLEGGSPLQVADNHRVAGEFESVIARALGIKEN